MSLGYAIFPTVPSIRVSRVGMVSRVSLPLLLRLVLVGLALWLVSGLALNEYRCEYDTLKLKQCR